LKKNIYFLFTFGLSIIVSTNTLAILSENHVLPIEMEGQFLGVETCGSSECHGSAERWRNATVLMKERLIWNSSRHASAYDSLKSELGRKITRNLGLPNGENVKQCLSCHSTYVPNSQRGERFSLTDGVTCESCHGPGGNFLSTHVYPSSTHEKNLLAGMTPTSEPDYRANLCLSCHQANKKNQFKHAFYGAGHPRLRFELETYSENLPYHYRYDSDYERRKGLVNGVQSWLIGQVLSTIQTLDYLEEAITQAKFIPELASFECFSCHQNINKPYSRKNSSFEFGTPSVYSGNLLMIKAIASTFPNSKSKRLKQLIDELMLPVSQKQETLTLIKEIRFLVQRLKFEAPYEEYRHIGPKLIKNIVKYANQETEISYGKAEMIAMSLSSLITSASGQGYLKSGSENVYEKSLDSLYTAVSNSMNFKEKRFKNTLKTLQAKL